jgi:hypothetical protein
VDTFCCVSVSAETEYFSMAKHSQSKRITVAVSIAALAFLKEIFAEY